MPITSTDKDFRQYAPARFVQIDLAAGTEQYCVMTNDGQLREADILMDGAGLLGADAAGPAQRITIGSNLSLVGGVLSATGGGGGWEPGTEDLDMEGFKIINLGLPSGLHHATPRSYVDAAIDALDAIYSQLGHHHDDRYYTEMETDTLLAGKSNIGHNHDERYYTESEVDTFLAGKANTSHTHATGDIVSGTFTVARGGTGRATLTLASIVIGAGTGAVNFLAPGVSGNFVRSNGSAWTSAAITAADLPDISGTYSVVGHNHDDRYYTEAEVDTFLAGKANSVHVHSGSAITSGTVGAAFLGSGTRDGTRFLRDDNTWQPVSSASTPLASSTVSGTVKTDVNQADPVVYVKASVDTALAGKANTSHTHVLADITGAGTMASQNASSVAITGGSATLGNTGLALRDTDASHVLTLAVGSNLTANRTLTITTGDVSRTLTMTGNASITGTNTGDQTITLTGAVTGSGTGSFATSFGSIAALSVLARSANTAGAPAAVTASANGQFFRMRSNAIGFGAIQADELPTTTWTTVTTTTHTPATTQDAIILYDVQTAGAAITVTLPSVAGNTGRRFTMIREDAGVTHKVTINRAGTDMIVTQTGNVTSLSLYHRGDTVVLESDGTNWRVIEDHRVRPYVKRSQSASQTLTTSTLTAIQFGTADFDFWSMWLPGFPSRINIRRPGKYRASALLVYGNNDTGTRQTMFYRNGVYQSDFALSAAAVAGIDKVPHSDYFNLSEGDYLEVYGWHNSGGNLAVGPSPFSWFAVEFVGD